jgi:peptidoglycan L-alanyl-D-glutamate endopeptidase CwlK
MAYILGIKSTHNLTGVHPHLVSLVRRAIQLTTQDFAVTDGLRTVAEQRHLVDRGMSKTMNSMHIKQADGWGHAVDLVPVINGAPRWEWGAIWPVAQAMNRAQTELGVRVRWGGCWEPLANIGDTEAALKAAVADYTARRRAMGRSAFLDGPHYELCA